MVIQEPHHFLNYKGHFPIKDGGVERGHFHQIKRRNIIRLYSIDNSIGFCVFANINFQFLDKSIKIGVHKKLILNDWQSLLVYLLKKHWHAKMFYIVKCLIAKREIWQSHGANKVYVKNKDEITEQKRRIACLIQLTVCNNQDTP